MFIEQLVIRRRKDGPPGAWDPPLSMTKPLDEAVNDWVDQTGNEIVAVTAPGMFMQWMDGDRTMRLVVASVMVTFVPAIGSPKPLIEDENAKPHIEGWEPV